MGMSYGRPLSICGLMGTSGSIRIQNLSFLLYLRDGTNVSVNQGVGPAEVSEMNFISKLTGGQIFCIAILGFMVLVMLEWFRRDTMIMPWPKVAVMWISAIIGGYIVIHGFREIQSGRWTGVIWVLIGPIISYMGGWGERIEYLKQKRAEKDQRRD